MIPRLQFLNEVIDVPVLVLPVLGGVDTLDDATVSFLLAQSLLERQKLQEMEDEAKRREEMRLKRKKVEEAKALRELLVQTERKMARIGRPVAAGSPVSADDLAAWQSWNAPDHTASSSSSSGKRKRKKKRKRRLPRNSSRPRLGLQWIQVPASVPEVFWNKFHSIST